MKLYLTLLLLTSFTALAAEPRLPLPSGQHTFKHRFAEHPSIPSITLQAKIDGNYIVLTNNDAFEVFSKGIIAEGTLMWHAPTRQWIIGHTPADKGAEEVGGCSHGPAVVDLQNKIYWTC